MNRRKVRTALNKVSKALHELQNATGDGGVLYLANIGIFTVRGKESDLSRTYGNVDRQTAINITENQLADLKDPELNKRKATRQQYEEVARELLADIPSEKLS